MAKKQKIKTATNRIKNNKTTKNTKSKCSFWKRAWKIICAPFKILKRACKRIWNWLCNINVIGVVNLTLLIAIIVLFLMLIIDFSNCRQDNVVIVRDKVEQVAVLPSEKNTENRHVVARPVKPVTDTLPLARDTQTRETINEPIVVAPANPCSAEIRQIAKVESQNKIMGDVVIDSRGSATIINHNTKINGNLYLQNMRKYTLPCGVRINGNLFLRDVNTLQFCGEFTVTGNIYVSPRSSFGPIPSTARLGGYVVL